jgi:hypothetical protein
MTATMAMMATLRRIFRRRIHINRETSLIEIVIERKVSTRCRFVTVWQQGLAEAVTKDEERRTIAWKRASTTSGDKISNFDTYPQSVQTRNCTTHSPIDGGFRVPLHSGTEPNKDW